MSSVNVFSAPHIAALMDFAMRRLVAELKASTTEYRNDLRSSHYRLLSMIPDEGARITDLAEICRVDDQVPGADTVGAAGYLPQVVAGLHGIVLPGGQFRGGRLRQGHDDPLNDASVSSQLIEPQLDAARADRTG